MRLLNRYIKTIKIEVDKNQNEITEAVKLYLDQNKEREKIFRLKLFDREDVLLKENQILIDINIAIPGHSLYTNGNINIAIVETGEAEKRILLCNLVPFRPEVKQGIGILFGALLMLNAVVIFTGVTGYSLMIIISSWSIFLVGLHIVFLMTRVVLEDFLFQFLHDAKLLNEKEARKRKFPKYGYW